MNDNWGKTPITAIALAVYVARGTGKLVHKDRPFHGFVLNDRDVVRDYCFSDGRVLHTKGETLFYLPRGSSYEVRTSRAGGCYAVNFACDIVDEPFAVRPRDGEGLLKCFRTACSAWRVRDPACVAAAMRAVYEAILQAGAEENYLSKQHQDQIAPALEAIRRDVSDRALTVAHLAALCGMSEVYFRKLFARRCGVSPKEYIIRRRMEYAAQLLSSGQFTVGDVARLCGYDEPCHFSREFKKRTGAPPRDCV